MRVLITGGGSDIGFALAQSLAARGDEIVATASTHASLEKMMARYDAAGIRATACAFDLSQAQHAEEAIQGILRDGLDGLVLNAWSRTPANKKLHEVGHDDFTEHLLTNVAGNHWLLKQCLPHMQQKNCGRIVFISSLSTVTGTGRYSSYIAGKNALEGLMRNIAVDYGADNICANTVRLGIVKTKRNQKYWRRGDYAERMASIIPSARLGETGDLGSILAPLLSEQQYINGSCLDVAGGLPGFAFSGLLTS